MGNTLRDEKSRSASAAGTCSPFLFFRNSTDVLTDRVFPGRQLAEELLFTTMARSLALFHIKPAIDGAVQPLDYMEGYTDGGIV